jgi:hypothetical protein
MRPARTVVLATVVGFVLFGLPFIALTGGTPQTAGASPAALTDIPANRLALYQQAASAYGLDWAVLAGIGKVECDHGRLPLTGCNPPGTVNFAGATGPMQFLAPTWRRGTTLGTVPPPGPPTSRTSDGYATDGNGDGLADVWNPADAIYAASRYLHANGAPGDYPRAIYAYNHSRQYVATVLRHADAYRAAPALPGDVNASAAALLANPRLHHYNPSWTRGDLQAGVVDPRVIAALSWALERHTVGIWVFKTGHSRLAASGNVSNHFYGRAVDIASVDGEVCTGTRIGACGRLAVELAALTGPLSSDELIYCFDPAPRDAGSWAQADHCDHIHMGFRVPT